MRRRFVSLTPVKVENSRDGGNYIGAMAIADDGTGWNLVYDKTKGWYWARVMDLPDSYKEPTIPVKP